MHYPKAEKGLLFLSLLSILSIIGLSYFTWPSSDDFSLYYDLSKTSVIDFMLTSYSHWDGRSLSVGSFVQKFLLKYCSAQVTIFIWSLCFVLNAFVLTKIIAHELKDRVTISLQQSFILSALVAVILWLGSYAHLSQTVYWATGGFYTFTNLMSSLWILLYYKLFEIDFRAYKRRMLYAVFVAVFIGSILVSSMSYNLVPAILVLSIIIAINKYNLSTWKKQIGWLLGFVFLGYVIGTIIMYAAPGSFNRAQYGPNTFQFSLFKMLYHFVYVLVFYLHVSIPLILLSAVGSFVVYSSFANEYSYSLSKRRFDKLNNQSINLKRNYNLSSFLLLLEKSKWLLAALATIVPFVAVPDFVSYRTSIFFMSYLMLFMVITMFPFVSKLLIHETNKKQNDTPKKIAKIALVTLFCVQVTIIAVHSYMAVNIKKQLTERYDFVQRPENKGKDIIVSPIKGYVPFSLRFDDISKDSSYWINHGVCLYYGVRSVRSR